MPCTVSGIVAITDITVNKDTGINHCKALFIHGAGNERIPATLNVYVAPKRGIMQPCEQAFYLVDGRCSIAANGVLAIDVSRLLPMPDMEPYPLRCTFTGTVQSLRQQNNPDQPEDRLVKFEVKSYTNLEARQFQILLNVNEKQYHKFLSKLSNGTELYATGTAYSISGNVMTLHNGDMSFLERFTPPVASKNVTKANRKSWFDDMRAKSAAASTDDSDSSQQSSASATNDTDNSWINRFCGKSQATENESVVQVENDDQSPPIDESLVDVEAEKDNDDAAEKDAESDDDQDLKPKSKKARNRKSLSTVVVSDDEEDEPAVKSRRTLKRNNK